jgi:hypothetical protein
MQQQVKAGIWVGLALLSAMTLAGCDEMAKFKERLKLTEAQAVQAQPMVEAYLQRQDKIFDEMQSEMSSSHHGGPGGMSGSGPGNESGFSGARPTTGSDTGGMKNQMDAKHKETEEKFRANDNATVKELAAFLSAEQLAEFPKIAEEIRQAKQKEMMQSGPGGGSGGPGMGGGNGGPGGGMGGPGF